MISTELLNYIRVLSESDTKTLSQKGLKTAEEVGELAKAILPYDTAFATNHRFVKATDILEECADTILCALSVAYDLKFSHDAIAEMLSKKSIVWAELQSKEHKFVYPVPYELHLTVKIEAGHSLEFFKDACQQIGVKPLLLDLQNTQGVNVMDDVMTSSKHFGTNRTAYEQLQRISIALQQFGFNVVREKVETVPWHPAAPVTRGQEMPKNCYFEAHIGVVLDDISNESGKRKLESIVQHHTAHLSKSVFKKTTEGKQVVMITLRSYDDYFAIFNQKLIELVQTLTKTEYTHEKPIVEFAVFDTNVSHDSAWIINS